MPRPENSAAGAMAEIEALELIDLGQRLPVYKSKTATIINAPKKRRIVVGGEADPPPV